MHMDSRYDRNIRLFGKHGQNILSRLTVAIVGVGGIGTHLIQQMAYLGVGSIFLIDPEVLEPSNLNRYVGAFPGDEGKEKVNIGKRMIHQVNPDIEVSKINAGLVNRESFAFIKMADFVFGCLDSEGSRFILNEFCLAYQRPFFDLATEIHPEAPETYYGGRVCFVSGQTGCLYCLDELDEEEIGVELQGPSQKEDRNNLYGVDFEHLNGTGPSVVSINGVIASLAVTEFMAEATGLRNACTLIKYYGERGNIRKSMDKGKPDCYYCNEIQGKGDDADIERYIRNGICDHS